MTQREKEIITEKVRGAYSILKDYEELYGTKREMYDFAHAMITGVRIYEENRKN